MPPRAPSPHRYHIGLADEEVEEEEVDEEDEEKEAASERANRESQPHRPTSLERSLGVGSGDDEELQIEQQSQRCQQQPPPSQRAIGKQPARD